MPSPEQVILLNRPRCRIPLGTPDETGSNWPSTPQIPTPAWTHMGNNPVPPTEVRAMADDENLYVRFDCTISDPLCLRTHNPHASVGQCERVYVEIAPHNDLCRWVRFQVDYRGGSDVASFRKISGEKSLEAVPDVWATSVPAGRVDWHVYNDFTGRTWNAEMVIPWKTLGLKERPATIGLDYARIYADNPDWPTLVSASWTTAEETESALLEPGEALIGDDVLAPARLEMARPRFGRNAGRLVFDRPAESAMTLIARTMAPGGAEVDSQRVGVPSGAKTVDFQFTLARAFSSYTEMFDKQRLEVILTDQVTGRIKYSAGLPMDRHLGVCVDEPCGEPTPSDAGLREAWLQRTVGALPVLQRRTTVQGAPSDFCLVLDNGEVAANLMADDAWQRLAEIVESCFATTEDRLVGAMALVGQKSVTNFILGPMFFKADGTPEHGRFMHELMGPLSIMRYGGGPAVCRAAVLARLLQHVTDPKTGKPFVTRVVSLSRDGGPEQVSRCYRGMKTLGPFVQQPEMIGAVVVDYEGSQTVLDPSALAFFPESPKVLATVEDMLADDTLRTRGADGLAEAYGKLNIEEMRRQPADRLLSHGVFPELCPNEFGPDKPFDARLHYRPPVVCAKKGVESDVLTGFRNNFEEKSIRDGAVRVSWDDKGLTVCVDVTGTDFDALQDIDRAFERVHLLIDADLDHYTFAHFMATASGERKAWQELSGGIQTLFKNLSSENWQEEAGLAADAWTADMEPSAEGYAARFDIPWTALDVDGAPDVVGLNVWIDCRKPHYEQVLLSRPRYWRLPADAVTFANIYLNDAPVMIESIEFGVPTWDDNVAEATLCNATDDDVKVVIHSENRLDMQRRVNRSAPVEVVVPAGGKVTAEFHYFIDQREKMGGVQKVIVLLESEGRTLFRGEWPANYCMPPGTYQKYGADIESSANPKPGEADFVAKKIRYICSRIPRFERLTTRDGAPSDFFLRAADESVAFNLMKAGVLDEIGDYIVGLFDNDVDRILGMYFFGYNPSVLRHMSAGHRIMNLAGPLSIIRGNFAGGGGNCGYHSRGFAGLISHLKIDGKPLVGHTVSIRGHVISGFHWRGSTALIDNDVGHFMLTADGTDFPTIDDMRTGPDIIGTANGGDVVRYFTFHDGSIRARRQVPDEGWMGCFPPGAPKA